MFQRRLSIVTFAISATVGLTLYSGSASAQLSPNCPLLSQQIVCPPAGSPHNVHISLSEALKTECAQIQLVSPAGVPAPQWPAAALGNYSLVDQTGLSDVLQLSNDATGAWVTVLSDPDDGGAPLTDLSLLPVQNAPDAGSFNEPQSPPTSLLQILCPGPGQNDAGIWGATNSKLLENVTVFFRSDVDTDAGQSPSATSDTVATNVPAAPPIALGALALLLMGGGVYMGRRQRRSDRG